MDYEIHLLMGLLRCWFSWYLQPLHMHTDCLSDKWQTTEALQRTDSWDTLHERPLAQYVQGSERHTRKKNVSLVSYLVTVVSGGGVAGDGSHAVGDGPVKRTRPTEGVKSRHHPCHWNRWFPLSHAAVAWQQCLALPTTATHTLSYR